MGNISGHQCKLKMSGSEKKVNENTYDIFLLKTCDLGRVYMELGTPV